MDTMAYTILYVDDEDVNLRLFKKTFRRDFNILLAGSAKEALDIIKAKKIDIIITDQRMPEMTGVELLKIVNQLLPDIPPHRLIVSGYSSNSDIDEAYNHRLHSFVQKPWQYDELKQLFLNVLNLNHT
jgi:DNA-binding NtrC family response regulator